MSKSVAQRRDKRPDRDLTQLEGVGGRHFEDEGKKLSAAAVGKSLGGVAPYTVDPDAAEQSDSSRSDATASDFRLLRRGWRC